MRGGARTWFWWHSWIGVTTGLMLFVICWSGTFAVLSHEIDWLLNPALRVAPAPPGAPAPRWAEVVAAAGRALPNHRVTYLMLPDGPRSAAEVWAEDREGVTTRVYVDPLTARVQGTTSYFNVQRFFRSFHMNLFFNTGPWGYLVVGAFALPLLASMASALLFYRRWWRRFLAFRPGHDARALFSALHKTGGLWSLWFVVLMGITGAWYFVEAAGIEPDYPEPPASPAAANARLPLDALMERARAQWPGLRITAVSLPGSYLGEVAAFEGQAGDLLVRDRANKLYLHPATGEVLARHRAVDLTAAQRWVDTADPLHFGDFGGLATKLVWLVFGLALSGLALTGAELHVRRSRARMQPVARPAVAAAYLVSALLLAASAVGGWHEIHGYGELADGGRRWPDVPLAVVAFIAVWIASTLGVLALWMRRVR